MKDAVWITGDAILTAIGGQHMRTAAWRVSLASGSITSGTGMRASDRGVPEALKAEEASLQQQIAEEQSRWSGINQRLEELERALDRR